MGLREIALDFSLLRQGLSIEHEFGPAALAELVRVARFLEQAFYEPASLVRTERGVAFTLLNPPLRVGAFGTARLLFDGVPLPRERCSFLPSGLEVSRRFSEVDRARPLILSPGRSVRFEMELEPPKPGRHEVRLELKSIAIPPLVWIEIYDTVRPGKDP
jgi:hypothetical protein